MKKAKPVTAKTSRIIAWAVLRDYLYYLADTRRVIRNNFLAGLFKGFGYAVGFSVVGAVFIWLLTALAARNLPLIGEMLQGILDILKENGKG